MTGLKIMNDKILIMKTLFLFITSLFFSFFLNGQDFVLSQFNNQNLLLNPAYTGDDDSYRFATNYRENSGGIIGSVSYTVLSRDS